MRQRRAQDFSLKNHLDNIPCGTIGALFESSHGYAVWMGQEACSSCICTSHSSQGQARCHTPPHLLPMQGAGLIIYLVDVYDVVDSNVSGRLGHMWFMTRS